MPASAEAWMLRWVRVRTVTGSSSLPGKLSSDRNRWDSVTFDGDALGGVVGRARPRAAPWPASTSTGHPLTDRPPGGGSGRLDHLANCGEPTRTRPELHLSYSLSE